MVQTLKSEMLYNIKWQKMYYDPHDSKYVLHIYFGSQNVSLGQIIYLADFWSGEWRQR